MDDAGGHTIIYAIGVPTERLKSRTGDIPMPIGRLLDIDQGDLDPAAALRGGLQGGDIHIISNTQAKVAVIQSNIGDDGIRDVAEPAPGARIEIDGILFVLAGADGPCAAKNDLMSPRLPVVKPAEVDGAGAACHGEVSPGVGCETDGHVDGVYA